MKKKKSKDSDWRNRKQDGFPYKGIDDPKYIRERDAVFKENGNGWWWGQKKSDKEEENG